MVLIQIFCRLAWFPGKGVSACSRDRRVCCRVCTGRHRSPAPPCGQRSRPPASVNIHCGKCPDTHSFRKLKFMSSSSSLWAERCFFFTCRQGKLLSGGLRGRQCKHDFLARWWQGCVLEWLPGDSTEVDRGGPPKPPSTEFVGLELLTEEYPEVIMSLPGSLLPQRGGMGPGDGGIWVSAAEACESWCPSSSSLDSWQQCCSGFK